MNFISRFLEKAKNFIISFFIPLNFNGVFGERIWQASSFSHPQRFVGKKVFLKVSFPPEMRFEMKIILRNEFRVPPSTSMLNFLSQSEFFNQLPGRHIEFLFLLLTKHLKPKITPTFRRESWVLLSKAVQDLLITNRMKFFKVVNFFIQIYFLVARVNLHFKWGNKNFST